MGHQTLKKKKDVKSVLERGRAAYNATDTSDQQGPSSKIINFCHSYPCHHQLQRINWKQNLIVPKTKSTWYGKLVFILNLKTCG